MGRTKGSANKAGHNAGGDRKSADFFEKKAEENERKKQAKERRKASEAARRERAHQGREFIANGALENGAFCTVFSENFHKF
jgi:ribosomal protein S21